ncbi:MAG: hypothetical protein BRC29_00725 [Nanohaloarchaea archaeon SW_7_43_1]|nr:MAG: hypothetical protein BRC29_00725 [Nanohaloarchaea archaeon SW_7_43_1]
MNYSFKETAKNSLEELDVDEVKEILRLIEEMIEEGFSHPKVKMIKERNGDWVYRLKVDRENTNHRVFLDYVEGDIKILDIMHRDVAYEGKYGNG